MDNIRDAWVEFLGRYAWRVYFTQTFAEPATYAHVAIKRTLSVLQQFAREYRLSSAEWWAFIAAEQHRSGVYHAHGLLGAVVDIWDLPYSLRRLWQIGKHRFGLCRYELIDELGGVVGYVSKYITKDLVDWSFVGNPSSVEVKRLL